MSATSVEQIIAKLRALPRVDVSAETCECCGTTYTEDVDKNGKYFRANDIDALIAEIEKESV